jgi:hypothetical protein
VALGARRFPRGGRTLRGGAARGGASCLPRQCATRHRAARLALEHPRYRARDAWPPMRLAFVLACRVGVSRTLTGVLLGLSSYRRSKINPRAPRFGEADGNGLLRRPRSMLTPADLADLLAYEFARLCRRRLTLAFVFARLLDCSLLRHRRPPSAKFYLLRFRVSLHRRGRAMRITINAPRVKLIPGLEASDALRHSRSRARGPAKGAALGDANRPRAVPLVRWPPAQSLVRDAQAPARPARRCDRRKRNRARRRCRPPWRPRPLV